MLKRLWSSRLASVFQALARATNAATSIRQPLGRPRTGGPGRRRVGVEFEDRFEEVLSFASRQARCRRPAGHGCSFVKWGFVKTARGLRAAAPGSVAARDIISYTWAHERAPDADE